MTLAPFVGTASKILVLITRSSLLMMSPPVSAGGTIKYAVTSMQDGLARRLRIENLMAQGSEYPAVVIPVLSQRYILLQRNVIYTAVTSGKRLVQGGTATPLRQDTWLLHPRCFSIPPGRIRRLSYLC